MWQVGCARGESYVIFLKHAAVNQRSGKYNCKTESERRHCCLPQGIHWPRMAFSLGFSELVCVHPSGGVVKETKPPALAGWGLTQQSSSQNQDPKVNFYSGQTKEDPTNMPDLA